MMPSTPSHLYMREQGNHIPASSYTTERGTLQQQRQHPLQNQQQQQQQQVTQLHKQVLHSAHGWDGKRVSCAAMSREHSNGMYPGPVLQVVTDLSRCRFLLPKAAETAACAATSAGEPLKVTVLGAGQDVGRSAVYVRRGERTLLFDCGSHLGAKQARKLPLLNLLLQLSPQQTSQPQETQNMEEALLRPSPLFASCTDGTIISHFHMDHCGSLPSFTERLGYRNPIAMTFPTRALSPVLLLDSARIFKETAFRGRLLTMQDAESVAREASTSAPGNGDGRGASLSAASSQEQWNYTEAEAQRCMRRCAALRLHESWEAGAWTATPYYAGHVLGAAMLHAQLPGNVSVVYTGDFNTAPDRHLGSANIPRLQPDLLISECTYGSFVRPSKRITEREFCDAVHDALKKGGKVLIPVFAVGRAQELCMLLNSYWKRMQLQYPIYFGGGMTEKANKYYKLYVQWTGSDLVHRLDSANSQSKALAGQAVEEIEELRALEAEQGAFSFSYISALPPDVLTAPTPMVLLATPGMLHGGLALKALKLWGGGQENLVLLPGYCVRGTVGAMLIDGQRDIPLDAKTRMKVVCKVRYMSFSAHADTTGIQQLARQLQPKAVMLVHGEKEGMMKLARVLQRELGVPIHTPPTGQTVSVPLACVEVGVPVYIHDRCLRRIASNSRKCTYPAFGSLMETSWNCDEPALSSVLGSAAMQRYMTNSTAQEQGPVSSPVCASPHFLPGASLLFSISVKPGSPAVEKRSSCKDSEGVHQEDVYILMDFSHLVSEASDISIRGCGSNRPPSRDKCPFQAEGESGHAKAESRNDRDNRASASSTSSDAASTRLSMPPRCLQLVTLRYSHTVEMHIAAFQQFLHLFMEYMVQCRHAYVQQRKLSTSANTGNSFQPALATPDFCDLGDNLEVREVGGGAVCLQFLSLVAVHNGQDKLAMQWADRDARKSGAVSLFVEYFSRLASTPYTS